MIDLCFVPPLQFAARWASFVEPRVNQNPHDSANKDGQTIICLECMWAWLVKDCLHDGDQD